MRRELASVAVGLLAATMPSCQARQPKPTARTASSTDRGAQGGMYPPAVDVAKVGSYPALTKSGAGYFYDDVLEYRVWVHHAEGGDDTYRAFAAWEAAAEYAKATAGAEEPLVLVRKQQWVDEPSAGQYIHMRSERITEWRVEWLAGSRRKPGSVSQFLRERGRGQGDGPDGVRDGNGSRGPRR